MKPLSVFIILQALDVVSTLAGLRIGAAEQNPLVSQIMSLGPVSGLLLSKIIVVGIASLAVWMQKFKGIHLANLAFAGVVVWNFSIIFKLAIPG